MHVEKSDGSGEGRGNVDILQLSMSCVSEKYCCHIGKQRMLQPSSHRITAALMVSPEGTQDGGKMPPI